jgi:hypothetical protein
MIRRGIRSSRTAEIIGISHQDFLDWIEFQFTESMNWENYGTVWCFEHCCPLSAFDLTNEEEIKKAMHWMNIRFFARLRTLKRKPQSIHGWRCFSKLRQRNFLMTKIIFKY